MNGKTSKKLRRIASMKALTPSDITFSRIVQYKLNPDLPLRGKLINIFDKNGDKIFTQRKFNPASAKAIFKKLKRYIRSTPWNKRSLLIGNFQDWFDNDHLKAFSTLDIDYEEHEKKHKEIYNL